MSPKSNQNIEENDLIEGCIEGNRIVQEKLYDRYAPKMFGVCLRYCGSNEDAEDVLQEGFIKIYKKIDGFRKEGSFEGWMRRIFVNTAIEKFRKKQYLQPVTGKEENSFKASTLSAIDQLKEKDILKLIQKLSTGYRTVFNLYVIEGYTHKEIGEILGISEGTSKSQLSRAKQLLQTMVTDLIDQDKKSTKTL